MIVKRLTALTRMTLLYAYGFDICRPTWPKKYIRKLLEFEMLKYKLKDKKHQLDK